MNAYRTKTADQLAYILKDAREALDCAKSLGDAKGEAKYADQINDAATEVYRRKQAVKAIATLAGEGFTIRVVQGDMANAFPFGIELRNEPGRLFDRIDGYATKALALEYAARRFAERAALVA